MISRCSIIILSIGLLLTSCIHTDVEVNGSITGSVRENKTLTAIGGCSISLTPGNNQIYSAENGIYQFSGLEMGDYTLTASKKGYCSLVEKITISAGKTLNHDIVLSPATIPTVSTDSVTNLSANTATICGTIVDDGGVAINQKGFYYGDDSTHFKKVFVTDTMAILTYNLVELTDGKIYYFQAFAINEVGESKGDIVSFSTTELFPPSVQTNAVTALGTKTVTLNGEITDKGFCNILSCGFYVGLSSTPNLKYTYPTNDSTALSLSINKLQSNTLYYYCVFAENKKGETKGEVLSFKTLDTSKPIVKTNEAADVTATSAKLQATLSDDGGCEVTEYGFYYGTSSTNMEKKKVTNLSSNAFTYKCLNLSEETTYYYQAFAANEKGESKGDILTFTTSYHKLPIVKTISATNVLATSATLNGEIKDKGDAEILVCGFYYGLDNNNLKRIPLSSVQNNIVYNVQGLEDGKTYYYKAFASNPYGEGVGEILSFETPEIKLPTIMTGAISNVSYTSATLSGKITNNGGSEILECGFYYGTESNPTTKYVNPTISNDFSCTLNDLTSGYTYYYQSYAKNSKGESKGQIVSFQTKIDLVPSVTTDVCTNISCIGAQINGTITDTNGKTITDCGFYYGTNTSDMTKISVWKPGITSFSYKLSTLKVNTSYYVKAYATSSVGEGFGDVVSFKTSRASYKVGTQEYEFAHGNLQYKYNPVFGEYSFAATQYEYLGTNNLELKDGYQTCWANAIDLFIYSATNISININNETWTCLSKAAWDYICSGRSDAQYKITVATVCEISGLIILPDEWELPNGVSPLNFDVKKFESNIFTQAQWQILEEAGATFLPAAGYLVSFSQKGFKGVGSSGAYWAGDNIGEYNSGNAVYFPSVLYNDYYIRTERMGSNYYLPLRLVKTIHN